MDFNSLFAQFVPQLTGAADAAPMAGAAPSLLGSTPPPTAPPVPMRAPFTAPPPQRQGGGAMDIIAEIAPLILSAFTAMKGDPGAAGALMQGVARGRQVAMDQRFKADEKERERRDFGAKFMAEMGMKAQQFETPDELDAFKRYVDPVGEQFGLPKGWTANLVFPAERLERSKLAKIRAALNDFDSNPNWKRVQAERPDYDESGLRLSGVNMTVAQARQIVDQEVTDTAGQRVQPPAKAPTPVKPPNKQYQRAEMLVKGKATIVSFDPDTNQYFLPGGTTPIEVQPIPEKPSAGRGGNGGSDDALVATVLANPPLWDNLTPAVRTRIAPKLAEQGFTGFGLAPTNSAIKQTAETRAAIAGLQDLRKTLQENEQFIGPVAGLSAMNPYSEARKAQAKIDLVRQRVGKALEGGVLRKEDEEKYKKILATLRDEPTTAIAKVDNLIATLERDMALFEDEQRRGGRRVTESSPTTKLKVGDIRYRKDGSKVRVTGFTAEGKAIVQVVQ